MSSTLQTDTTGVVSQRTFSTSDTVVPETPHRDSVAEALAPKYRLPKKLIVCCDGTWKDADNGWKNGKLENPSNVTRISRAIASEDDRHHPQITYYQAGVGTGLGLWSQLVGGGTGLGLSENIREAYAFLASNYSEHDQLTMVEPDSIFLVGFSRGAFTARSIGGLIGAIGVLKRHAMSHFYEIFMDWEHAGDPNYDPIFFKRYFEERPTETRVSPSDELAHDKNRIDEYMDLYRRYLVDLGLSQEAKVKCIGVWDTVGALGIPINPTLRKIFPLLPAFIRDYQWFDTRTGNHVENAFHALAMDEHRAPFSPTLWEKPPGCTTNLRQVWFPGAHSNIGGSYSDYGMADITIAWMMDQLAGNTRDPQQEFRPLDWIKFDEDLIEHFYRLRVKYYTRHDCYKGWGLGRVYDSLTFPQNLAGSITRTPAGYHKTFYETGNQDPKRLLHNTHEYIHSSVRVRIDLGGAARQPDPDDVFPHGLNFKPLFTRFWEYITRSKPPVYQPHLHGGPLAGWTLVDGHMHHNEPNHNIETGEVREIKWVYEGENASIAQGMIVPEDKLGPIERKMLQNDASLAPEVVASNNSRFAWFGIPHHVQHGQTF